jgi:UDP-N-acetylmuramoylalanine--D-glutamate ligase
MDVSGQRVTIMGLGRHGGGVAAARFVAERGAAVTVTDKAEPQTLGDSLERLADVRIGRFTLGGHREIDFRRAEVVVVNPAVRQDDWFLNLARQSGATITTEIELFLNACPATIIGVTGSNGKSTTAAMTAEILRAGARRTWLGGNIGRSLLGDLAEMRSDDIVVLELSSFQLAQLSAEARLPEIAVVTNCTPNHLDWHADMADYVAAKQRILSGQRAEDMSLLNPHDEQVAGWSHLARGRPLAVLPLESLPPLAVPGRHNRENAACATAAARAAGCSESAIDTGLRSFRGLPHRLELVSEIAGRKFYNDSMATTPESVIAALDALDGPTWLLAGGHDKGADFAALGEALGRKARGAAFYGAARDVLRAAMDRDAPQCTTTETLAEALDWCWRRSQPGDHIVLSPACASYDQFVDFADRGEIFARYVRRLADG